jgi:Cu+-exporting ATPase
MKRILIALMVIIVITAVALGAYAAADQATKATKGKPISAICPVLGTRIPDITQASGKSVYKGKTYYFCCAGCKAKFDANPEKYIHKTSAKQTHRPVSAVCPVTHTKIPDIRYASGKSVYKGKTYYFCCAGCKKAFDANPKKYVGR